VPLTSETADRNLIAHSLYHYRHVVEVGTPGSMLAAKIKRTAPTMEKLKGTMLYRQHQNQLAVT
jgi:hypothetical protein